MWHVIAPIVRWPLHSPWRLASVIGAFLVLVVIAGEVNGNDSAPAAAEPVPAVTETAGTGDAASAASPDGWPSSSPLGPWSEDEEAVHDSGNHDAYETDPAETNPSVAAAEAAAEFVAAWARPDLGVDSWRAGVRPLVTDRLYDRLQDTEPANTPDVTVAGEPLDVAINAEAGVFDVPTTGTHVRVFVELDADKDVWLVNDVQPTT